MDEALIFGPGAEAIWQGKKRKRQASANAIGSGVSAAHVAKLGEAEQLYIEGHLAEAVRVLSDIAKEVPRWSEPYTVLALIYEALGQKKEALQLYMLCAAFQSKRKRSIEPWKKVVYFAYDMKQYHQSLHAVRKCLKGEETEDTHGLRRLRLVLLVKVSKVKDAISAVKQHSDAHPQDHAIYLDLANALLEEGYPSTALRFYKNFLARLGIHIEADSSLFPTAASAAKSLASVSYDGEYIRLRGPNLLEEIASHYDEICSALMQTCALNLSLYNFPELVIESIETFFSLYCSTAALQDVVFPMSLVSLLSRAKLISLPDPEPALIQLDPLLAPSALTHNLQSLEVLEQLVGCAGKMMALGMVAKSLRLCDAAVLRLADVSDKDDPHGLAPRIWMSLCDAYLQAPAREGQRGQDVLVAQCANCLRNTLGVMPEGKRAVEVLAQALDLAHRLLGLLDNADIALPNDVQRDLCEVCAEIRSRAWEILRALVLDSRALIATRTSPLDLGPIETGEESAGGASGSRPNAAGMGDASTLRSSPSAASSSQPSALPDRPSRSAFSDDEEELAEDEDEGEEEDDEAYPSRPSTLPPPSASLPVAPLPSREDRDDAEAGGADMDEEAAAEAMEALLQLSNSVTNSGPSHAKSEPPPAQSSLEPLAVFPRHSCSRHVLSAVFLLLMRWTRAVHWSHLPEATSQQKMWSRVLLRAKLVEGWTTLVPVCTGRAGARRLPRELLPTTEISQLAAGHSRNLATSLEDVSTDDDVRALAAVFCATARYCPAPGTGDTAAELLAVLEAEVARLREEGREEEADQYGQLLHPAVEATDRSREREGVSRLAVPRRSASSSTTTVPSIWSSLHLALALEDTHSAQLSWPSRANSTAPNGGSTSTSSLLGEQPGNVLFNASSRDRKLIHLLEHYVRSLEQLTNPLARNAAKVFLLQPDNIAAINLLARAIIPQHRAVEDALSVRATCYSKARATALSELLMGNEEALYKRHGPVLEHYLQALHLMARQQAEQANMAEGGLVYLVLGSYLLMLAMHPIMKQRQDLLLRAWSILTLYTQARMRWAAHQAEGKNGEGESAHHDYLQEVYYNMGRACQDIRLDHLAVTYYRMALQLEDHSVLASKRRLRLTKQTAHNLILLYTQAGSVEVAYDLMASYLAIA